MHLGGLFKGSEQYVSDGLCQSSSTAKEKKIEDCSYCYYSKLSSCGSCVSLCSRIFWQTNVVETHLKIDNLQSKLYEFIIYSIVSAKGKLSSFLIFFLISCEQPSSQIGMGSNAMAKKIS